jgi:hydroxyacylglutathione hydrolase
MNIRIFPAFEDNYIYLIEDQKGDAVLVDPAESRSVLRHLEQHHLILKTILITHSHADHTGGIETIKQQTGCRVAGPQSAGIPMQDVGVQDGQVLDFSCPIRVLSTPGHTPDSVCYYVQPPPDQPGVLFTGDSLFIHGCGRLLGCRPQVLWQSLQKLSALPPDTQVYCGHEYTEENCRFALTLEPDNPRLLQRLEEVREQIRHGQPTVPSTIGQENEFNPFLRAGSEPIRRALAMPEAADWQVFAELRKRKDRF